MLVLFCKLWPYLAGFLIGWLLCGWIARRLKYCPAPITKTVEKQVTVEKLVDNPEHLARISVLESQVQAATNTSAIDLAAAKAAGIIIKTEDDFSAIEGIGPKINELIHADGIATFCELAEVESTRLQRILDDAGANFKLANPGTWPDQAMLACNNRWSALKALQDILDGGVYPDPSAFADGKRSITENAQHLDRIDELQQKIDDMQRGPQIDIGLARAAGFTPKGADVNEQADFTVVEGVGPKINELIHAAGIHTYLELSQTDVSVVQKILDDAGPNYQLARPKTWPAQSGLAASNQWEALKAWQDVLDGGEE